MSLGEATLLFRMARSKLSPIFPRNSSKEVSMYYNVEGSSVTVQRVALVLIHIALSVDFPCLEDLCNKTVAHLRCFGERGRPRRPERVLYGAWSGSCVP